MKLLSYGLDYNMEPRLAFSQKGQIIDVMRASLWMKEERGAQDYLNLASSMKLLLQDWGRSQTLLKQLEDVFQTIDTAGLSVFNRPVALPENDVSIFAPIPDPPGLRLFNAFREDQRLGFQFGNTQTLLGHRQTLAYSGLTAQVELAAIIGSDRNNTNPEIAGYTIINNWNDTAESLGLAVGQATSLGPYLITADEINPLKIGNGFNMDFQIRVNGEIDKEDRFKTMKYSFQEMIQHASKTNILAGDLFCSGSPVQINKSPVVKPGDILEIEVQGLGVLTTPIE